MEKVNVGLGLSFLEKKMKEIGFRELSRSELSRAWQELGFSNENAPRQRDYDEIVYTMTINKYTIIVYSSISISKDSLIKSKPGWVIIVDKDGKKVHSENMIRRYSQKFFYNLYCYSLMNKDRLMGMPCCSCVSGEIILVKRKITIVSEGKSVEMDDLYEKDFCCNNLTKHESGRPEYFDWNKSLSKESKSFHKKINSWRNSYKDMRVSAGLSYGRAREIRKPW